MNGSASLTGKDSCICNFDDFAGCPVCDLHLHTIVQRHSEIMAASILEAVVFHTSAEELLRYAGDLPFAVIADPDKRLYAAFGVESGRRALLDPRVWGPMLSKMETMVSNGGT